MKSYPLFVSGDFDGFIGLFIDNLVNLLLISFLTTVVLKMPADLVFGTILPATAFSVLVGNIFYSWQARRLAQKEQRLDVTALPYGINTVSVLAFFSLIMVPVYFQNVDVLGKHEAALLAWKIGVISCLISGLFEGIGSFWGEKLRRITPRAALLASLAGIAIVFIALQHTFKIWEKPLIAFIPLALILMEYFSHIKLPFRIPAGFYALFAGSALAWATGSMDAAVLGQSINDVSLHVPGLAIFSVFEGLQWQSIAPYLSISIPMGLFSFFATIQNLESAEAAGDRYEATPALAMNGLGTIVGSLFGSPFPTTVYIGHPGWKGLGARTGYSIINGTVVTLICLTGFMSVIKAAIPIEAGYPILIWIGVVITAQAFQSIPKSHAPAVALGLMPGIAAWGLSMLRQFIGKSTAEADKLIMEKLPDLKGIIAFSEGSLLTSIFLTAVAVYLIEKKFLHAFYWALPLVVFSFFGLIHTTQIGISNTGSLPLGYTLFAFIFLAVYFWDKYSRPKSRQE